MRMLNIAATVLALLAIAGLPAAVIGYQALRDSGFDGQVVTLTGAHGTWDHEAIHLRQGEKVRLRITSNDVVHGFALEAYGIEIDEVYPGKVTVVDFVADRPGSFPFACTILCSGDHRDMKGKLVVEPQTSGSEVTS
ncbi:MAG: cupredoxin domain-containing protein [Chloroflexi bacterium]|nr:cupredoxin domain-containing protein [Chloroflexota bacterium]